MRLEKKRIQVITEDETHNASQEEVTQTGCDVCAQACRSKLPVGRKQIAVCNSISAESKELYKSAKPENLYGLNLFLRAFHVWTKEDSHSISNAPVNLYVPPHGSAYIAPSSSVPCFLKDASLN